MDAFAFVRYHDVLLQLHPIPTSPPIHFPTLTVRLRSSSVGKASADVSSSLFNPRRSCSKSATPSSRASRWPPVGVVSGARSSGRCRGGSSQLTSSRRGAVVRLEGEGRVGRSLTAAIRKLLPGRRTQGRSPADGGRKGTSPGASQPHGAILPCCMDAMQGLRRAPSSATKRLGHPPRSSLQNASQFARLAVSTRLHGRSMCF